MRILLAQINPTIGDFAGNRRKILAALESARKESVQMVVFPELAITGYPPGDFLLVPHFIEEAEKVLATVVEASHSLAVVIGVPRQKNCGNGKNLYNSAAVIEDGRLLGFQDKRLLPTYDVFDELRYFEPGREHKVWEIAGKKVAITICEDIWQHSSLLKEAEYHCDPVMDLAKASPDFVINLSASPFALSKWKLRLQACAKAAQTLKAPFLLCNQVGGNDSLIFAGRSMFLSQDGELLAVAKSFEEDVLLVDLAKDYTPIALAVDKEEELYQALVLGVRDYLQKSGFKKACIGLSGGIDSAVVACIAVEALGAANVLCINMPSRFSSQEGIADALRLASNLGVECPVISIEPPFQSFLDVLKPHFGDMAWDVTEENMQARLRGVIVMSFSNKFGSIVLSTGNKSELAMGYSTLYGDMCGGLSVIGDLTKLQTFALARWINREQEVIPQEILSKAPSAELRPNQKDSDSLPDYAILDPIIQAYVELQMDPQQIAERFNCSLSFVQDIIQRIHRNEFKRYQSAPALRISEKAFSVGRSFPIVQKFI